MEDFLSLEENNPLAPIDLSIFKDHIEESLLGILSSLPKVEKTLIVDKSCVSALNYFTNISKLEKEMVRKELNTLRKSPFYSDSSIHIYLIPAKQECLEMIEMHISCHVKLLEQKQEKLNVQQKENKKIDNKQFHIIFIPKINNECQSFIKNSYKYEHYYYIHNLGIDIYPFDYDLMSLEQPDCIRDIYINQNYNILSVLCKAFIKIETVFGKIKYKFYKGEISSKLNGLIEKEENNRIFDDNTDFLGSFFIDRNVDFITPFCTANTYESLLDEYFGINFNSIRISSKILSRKDTKKDMIKVDLSNRNKFYSNIKNYGFPRLSVFLQKRLKNYNDLLNKSKKETDLEIIKKNLENISILKTEKPYLDDNIIIADILSTQKKNPINQLYLTYEHMLLSSFYPPSLQEFYENEMGKHCSYYNLLRLICLESLTQNGIKSKQYDYLKKEFLSVYGYQNLILWNNLEKLKILKKYERSSNYDKISQKLNLLIEEINEFSPDDASFAYSGYCPISVRLIEKGIKNGWSNIKDVFDALPGEYYFSKDEKEIMNPNEKKFILLVYIGGITFGEIAAIRFLNETMQFHKFIILTTSIINSKKIFDSLSMKDNQPFSFQEYYNSIKKTIK